MVNILPLLFLTGMILYIRQFQSSLLEENITALREQANIYAGAISETAVSFRGSNKFELDVSKARPLLTSLVDASWNTHARLYTVDGHIVAERRRGNDNRVDHSVARHHGFHMWGDEAISWILSCLPLRSPEGVVPFEESSSEDANDSLEGISPFSSQQELPPYIRRTETNELVITVVEPVVKNGETLGEVQLTRHDSEIDKSLFSVRSSIIILLIFTLGASILLSWYLSMTIARPLRQLVQSSKDMREPGKGRIDSVPQSLLARRDEIGELARALRIGTFALWARLDDIERFAAEVSHELRNPLSSIRSALEALPRMSDIVAKKRLLDIVRGDVQRLDRLIVDISDASRVDGDLQKGHREVVSLVPLLEILVELHQATRDKESVHIDLKILGDIESLKVWAVEDRLVQVFRNLIGNAISFSPPLGHVTISLSPCWGASLRKENGTLIPGRREVEISVTDQGPGIPAAKLESIFERFYSERPKGENYEHHSGLGLAISRQIIQGFDGHLYAENCVDECEEEKRCVTGARFVIRLPRAVLDGDNTRT